MDGHPLTQPATSSHMRFLTAKHAIPLPHPPHMSNDGNFVVSLSRVAAWLGAHAEALGAEVYPGFAGAALLRDGGGAVRGVRTNEVGLDRARRMKGAFEPGMAFRARVTLLAEGAHGSLTKQAVRAFDLRKDADPQTYGIGLKEVWRVDPALHVPGHVTHTVGWPLDARTYGGGWAYHMADGLVSLGLVVGLDYANPHLSPYRELQVCPFSPFSAGHALNTSQRMKHHPMYRALLAGGTRIAYGARALTEGGLQSLPTLHFPGGALLGCAAGMVNVPKIKGSHNALKSGMLAADAAFAHLSALPEEIGEDEPAADMSGYSEAFKGSWAYKELHEVRNIRPAFHGPLGLYGGLAHAGLDAFVLKGRVPWTLRNRTRASDAAQTRPAAECTPIEYPPFEAPLSTDLLTSLALTGTNHGEDEPAHLRVVGGLQAPEAGHHTEGSAAPSGAGDLEAGAGAPPSSTETAAARAEHVRRNVGEYAGLLGRACPAQVYEYVDAAPGEPGSWDGHKLVVNAQNCIHCKLCDIKVPTQDINWTVPEGGGGPKYCTCCAALRGGWRLTACSDHVGRAYMHVSSLVGYRFAFAWHPGVCVCGACRLPSQRAGALSWVGRWCGRWQCAARARRVQDFFMGHGHRLGCVRAGRT
jgi:electron-transferring-flavoprotein dehydrogenase